MQFQAILQCCAASGGTERSFYLGTTVKELQHPVNCSSSRGSQSVTRGETGLMVIAMLESVRKYMIFWKLLQHRISGGMRMKVSQSGLDESPVRCIKSWDFFNEIKNVHTLDLHSC